MGKNRLVRDLYSSLSSHWNAEVVSGGGPHPSLVCLILSSLPQFALIRSQPWAKTSLASRKGRQHTRNVESLTVEFLFYDGFLFSFKTLWSSWTRFAPSIPYPGPFVSPCPDHNKRHFLWLVPSSPFLSLTSSAQGPKYPTPDWCSSSPLSNSLCPPKRLIV